MRLYEKIVSQKSEPGGESWTESSKELPRQMLLRLLGCQDWNTHTQWRHTNAVWPHIHMNAHAGTHTHTQRVGFAFAVPFLGSCSHQPGLTPRLSVAVTAVSLWINMDGAAPSTTHTGPNNKTSKSLSPVCLPHARRGLPWSSHILSGLLLDLHSPFVALFKKSPIKIKVFSSTLTDVFTPSFDEQQFCTTHENYFHVSTRKARVISLDWVLNKYIQANKVGAKAAHKNQMQNRIWPHLYLG